MLLWLLPRIDPKGHRPSIIGRKSQMGERRSPRWPHQPISQDWRAGCKKHSIINEHHRHERRPHQPIRQDWRAGCKQHSIINDHHRHERLALQLVVRWSNFLKQLVLQRGNKLLVLSRINTKHLVLSRSSTKNLVLSRSNTKKLVLLRDNNKFRCHRVTTLNY